MTFRTKLLATAAVLALLVSAIAAVVHSSFTATAKNEGNSFETGSISLTDNDNEQVLFNASGLEPASAPQRKCIQVTYGSSGTLKSSVRLFGTTSGALAPHLNLKVTRGSFASGAANTSCDGFTADASGVLFDDALSAYPDSWADGIVDPRAAWQAGDKAAYQLEVSLDDSDDAQGKSASQAFAFEARTA
jgi:hypothetical protein